MIRLTQRIQKKVMKAQGEEQPPKYFSP